MPWRFSKLPTNRSDNPSSCWLATRSFSSGPCGPRSSLDRLGDGDPDFAVDVIPGDKTDFTVIRNDLDTVPFLATTKIVIVEQADTFVTANRTTLEQYVVTPSKVGILILDVKTLPRNDEAGQSSTDCGKDSMQSSRDWQTFRVVSIVGRTQHGKRLMPDAAELLVDRVGSGMGLLDSELTKLAITVGTKKRFGAEHVDKFVSQTRAADAVQNHGRDRQRPTRDRDVDPGPPL